MSSSRRPPLAASHAPDQKSVTAEVVASRKGCERAKIPPFPEAELTDVHQHTGSDRGSDHLAQHLLIGGAVEQLAFLSFQGGGPVPAALIETAKVS